MSHMAAGGVMGRGAKSNIVFPGTSPASEGSHEPEILALEPAVYLKFGGDFSDSSGNGRNGTLVGSGGSFVAALASNVGTGNFAFDTEGTASISVAHATADTALTFPTDWEALYNASPGTAPETLLAPYRFIGAFGAAIHFEVNALPTGNDHAVIIAKSNASRTVYDGSWEAYFDANGAVHLEVRSFRGRPARVRTPNSMVSAGGGPYHLTVRCDYDGVTAWLVGAQFAEGLRDGVSQGIPDLMHVYGLAANILGTTHANTHAWTIGKAAWGGQADITVDEPAIFLRRPSTTLSQGNVNTLAQVGSTPTPIPHHVWGALTVNASSYSGTGATQVNNAIDDVSASGGGTVAINGGSISGGVVLKSNVRIRTTGTVNVSGTLRCGSVSVAEIGAGSATLAAGATVFTKTNTRSARDLITIEGGAALRHDQRWNTTTESNDSGVNDTQTFEIASRTGSDMTFEGAGSIFTFTAANQASVLAWTPISWIAAEGDIRFAGTNAIQLTRCSNARLIGIRGTNTDPDSAQGVEVQTSIYVQGRNLTNVQATWNGVSMSENDGIQVRFASSDVVFKDCEVFDGRHCADVSGNAAQGGVTRVEFHNFTWDNTDARSAPGSVAAFGVHGMSTECIYWNFETNWGGPCVTGWKHDCRWAVCGNTAGASGEIQINDGAGDGYLRDIHILRPINWFRSTEGDVGVDRCRFERITRSATQTSLLHAGLNYGTGANVNTYSNVDGLPDPNPWQEV